LNTKYFFQLAAYNVPQSFELCLVGFQFGVPSRVYQHMSHHANYCADLLI